MLSFLWLVGLLSQVGACEMTVGTHQLTLGDLGQNFGPTDVVAIQGADMVLLVPNVIPLHDIPGIGHTAVSAGLHVLESVVPFRPFTSEFPSVDEIGCFHFGQEIRQSMSHTGAVLAFGEWLVAPSSSPVEVGQGLRLSTLGALLHQDIVPP